MLDHTYVDYLPRGHYQPSGDFLNFGVQDFFSNLSNKAFNWNGIIMVRGGGVNRAFYYNPVTIAQYALTLYGQSIYGRPTISNALKQASYLIKMQREDGSFPYNTDFPYYVEPDKYFQSGWTSAMANGNALSIFARAYCLTGQEKYSAAAEKAICALQIPIEQGGTLATLEALNPEWGNYNIYEEYPVSPPTYTLNGFMYTLIGIYDWTCIESRFLSTTKKLFDDGINTLEKILPYYDIGGFTAYDLAHITHERTTPHIGVGYHSEHTAFCKIFYDLTERDVFKHYYDLWSSYVD